MERHEKAEKLSAIGLSALLEQAGVGDDEQVLERAAAWVDAQKPASVDDIVQFGLVDDFVNALDLPTIPKAKLLGALKPTTVAVSGWFGQQPVAPVVQMGQPPIQMGSPPVPMGFAIDATAVQPVVAPTPMVMDASTPMVMDASGPPISFLPVTEYDEVWNSAGTGAKKDASVWKAQVPPGCYLLGLTANKGHSKPTFPTLVVANPQPDQIKPPDRYELAWSDKRPTDRPSFWLWHPIPPPGYVALGEVGTFSDQPPSREEVVCVAISSLFGVKQPLGVQMWIDHGTRPPFGKDGAFWTMPGGSGLFRCVDGHNRPRHFFGGFYIPKGEDLLVVTGAVRGNGVYQPDGTFNGKARYVHVSDPRQEILWIQLGGTAWHITTDRKQPWAGAWTCKSEGNPERPATHGWEVDRGCCRQWLFLPTVTHYS